MIISKTPLRISFCGGGTDLKEYWADYGGAVVSSSINKYIYIIAKERGDNEIWLKYSENEIVKKVEEIKNNIWRECLKKTGIYKGIEIASLSDIPKGTGLAGSSTFTVGSLNSLYALTGKNKSHEELAKEACEVEIDLLKEPIGKQDQYISAYGGLNLIEFKREGDVVMSPIYLSNSLKKEFDSNLLLFYTGISRDAKSVLSQQQSEINSKGEILHKMKEFAYSTRDALKSTDLRIVGELLHKNWEYKKQMAGNISNPDIDKYYNLARENGAIGGKICGAGAGGFLLLYVEPEKQDKVKHALKDLNELSFNLESSGSKIIHSEF